MKKFVALLFILSFSSAFAADFTMTSRDFQENNKGEIIQVDSLVTKRNGDIATSLEISQSIVYEGKEVLTHTQYKLIPATSEVRNQLLSARGEITVEGSELATEISTSQNGRQIFKLIKVLVREVK